MPKRRKRSVPIMLFWSRCEQRRFIESVERMQSLVNDLEKVLEPAKRRKLANSKTRDEQVNGKTE